VLPHPARDIRYCLTSMQKPRKKLPMFQREWTIKWKNSPLFSEDQKVPPLSIIKFMMDQANGT